jgi:release factor glutamine methyltransferase
VDPVALALPLAELAIAMSLVISPSAWWAAIAAFALLAIFVAAMLVSLARGRAPDCHCFGQLHSEPVGPSSIARTVALAAVAAFVASQDPANRDAHALRWATTLSTAQRFEVGLGTGVLLLTAVAAQLWFLNRLLRENRALVARIEAPDENSDAGDSAQAEDRRQLAQPVITLQTQAPQRLVGETEATLKLGEPAPTVGFLDMFGRTKSLADFQGRDTLVLFWNSNSRSCTRLLPGLKAFEGRPPRSVPRLLVVVQGSASGKQVVDFRSPVVIDRDASLARAFGIDDAPSAILVDARGNIASDLAAGPEQVLALAGGEMPHSRGRVRWAGLDFEVSRDVITPRLETETVAEKAVQLARDRSARVLADIGTGSGAIATFLARELPQVRVYAVDVSAEALAVAKRNLERHQVAGRVELLQGNLLEPLPERPDLIVADIPYLSDEVMATIGQRVRFEPRIALYGGPTGLEVYAELFAQLIERNWVVPLVLEISPLLSEGMRDLLKGTFESGEIQILPDFQGLDRIAVFVPERADDKETATPRLKGRRLDLIGALLTRVDGRSK